MGVPKSLAGYPAEYYELFQRATYEEIEVPCDTKKEAEALRLRLYGFRSALLESPDGNEELALLSTSLVLVIREGNLVILPEDPKNALIRKALRRAAQNKDKA